jgi:hypothetical protein
MHMNRHSVLRDGVVAGFLGATAVAMMFFFVDLIMGRPLFTPLGLGRGLISLLGPGHIDAPAVVITVYTIFHYLAFMAVATFAAFIMHVARRMPGVLAGAFVMFVVIEIGFYFWSSILAGSPFFGTLSWVQVSVGNLVAALVMGIYLWRTHPEIAHELDLALKGEDDPGTVGPETAMSGR